MAVGERNATFVEHWKTNPGFWEYEPCAIEHVPGRVCILRVGHSKSSLPVAHLVLEHQDGTKCIWIDATETRDGYWFIPYDVGGEGVPCHLDHPFMQTAKADGDG